MRLKAITALCIMTVGIVLIQGKAVCGGGAGATVKPTVAVTLREGPCAQWHHRGDELIVTYGQETLLSIELGQSTIYSVPLTLTLAPSGRIFKWDKAFNDPSLGTAITTYTMFHCNGDPVQQFRTVMWANFDLGLAEPATVMLALPEEGLQYWVLHKIDERSATLTRQIDPCYVSLLKNGGKIERAGRWNAAAMNCVLYVMVGDQSRQFNISLPWPVVNPPGTGFRP